MQVVDAEIGFWGGSHSRQDKEAGALPIILLKRKISFCFFENILLIFIYAHVRICAGGRRDIWGRTHADPCRLLRHGVADTRDANLCDWTGTVTSPWGSPIGRPCEQKKTIGTHSESKTATIKPCGVANDPFSQPCPLQSRIAIMRLPADHTR